MSLRILAIDPSYWQRTAAGLLAVLVVGLLVAVAVEALARIVFAPRAAGRRWPEGAGRGGILRIPAAMVIELQRRTPALEGRAADLADGAVAVRVGLALGTLAVVPLSTGLVVAQPGSGLFVLPVLLVADAVVLAVLQVVIADPAARDRRRADAAERALVRIGAACVLGLSGGAVVAQWGSASLPVVVAAQAHTAAFGIAGWGLPTALVQLPALLVACAMLHLVAVRLSPAAAERPLGGARGFVDRIAGSVWLVAGAAWLVVCFLGGGAVPWRVDNDGVRHLLSVVLLLSKLLAVCVALAWSRVTWPEVSPEVARLALAIGAGAAICSIGGTLLVRWAV